MHEIVKKDSIHNRNKQMGVFSVRAKRVLRRRRRRGSAIQNWHVERSASNGLNGFFLSVLRDVSILLISIPITCITNE